MGTHTGTKTHMRLSVVLLGRQGDRSDFHALLHLIIMHLFRYRRCGNLLVLSLFFKRPCRKLPSLLVLISLISLCNLSVSPLWVSPYGMSYQSRMRYLARSINRTSLPTAGFCQGAIPCFSTPEWGIPSLGSGRCDPTYPLGVRPTYIIPNVGRTPSR